MCKLAIEWWYIRNRLNLEGKATMSHGLHDLRFHRNSRNCYCKGRRERPITPKNRLETTRLNRTPLNLT